MSRTDGSRMTHAISKDGTEIAFWTSGQGPPLVLVHGATADHSRWRPLLPQLEPHVTVHAMDRRGRGASGDAPDYRLAREFEDVAAVVDAVAEAAGCAVDVYGHSFGGLCAFGGAASTTNVRKLVLYEGWPPADPSVFAPPPGVAERLDVLLAEGDRDGVVESFLRDVARVPDEEVRLLRAQPSWQARVDAAHTIRRELEAVPDGTFRPEWVAGVTNPVLLLRGEERPDPWAANIEPVAAALPDARIVVLEGQRHLADVLAPEAFAEQVLAFLRGEQ